MNVFFIALKKTTQRVVYFIGFFPCKHVFLLSLPNKNLLSLSFCFDMKCLFLEPVKEKTIATVTIHKTQTWNGYHFFFAMSLHVVFFFFFPVFSRAENGKDIRDSEGAGWAKTCGELSGQSGSPWKQQRPGWLGFHTVKTMGWLWEQGHGARVVCSR